ncbi:MAG: diguanylate cyclase, partial [Acidimicrobiia bacterium]|nr:diguanylate cyclase [Acidimicrobiia bacterium]
MGTEEAFVWESGAAADGLLGQVLSTMGEGVVILGEDGAFVGHNKAAESILGLSSDQLMGRKPTDEQWHPTHTDGTYYPPEDHPAVRTMQSGEPHTDIMGVSRPDGTQRWIRVSSNPIFLGESRYTAATFADITQLQMTSGMAEHFAHRDLLTDVPNRIMFEQLVEVALERAPEDHVGCAVVAVGIDHFGSTNKHLGPRGADQVLIETAKRIRALAGDRADVGRIGDDQFAVLLRNPGPDGQVRTFAESLRLSLGDPIAHNGEEHLPSITVGVVVGRSDGGHGLIMAAVEALEAAKQRERGSIRFFDGHDPRERLVYQQSQGIRRAIADQVVRLWYQPIRDLSSKAKIGAEALFRVDVAGERVVLTPD